MHANIKQACMQATTPEVQTHHPAYMKAFHEVGDACHTSAMRSFCVRLTARAMSSGVEVRSSTRISMSRMTVTASVYMNMDLWRSS